MMNNFNLLISTYRFNEIHAKSESWFILLICGDKYPIISQLEYSGLLTAFTILNNRKVISKVRKLMKKKENLFHQVLKIVPIDYVCETDLELIKLIVKNNYKNFIAPKETFKIDLKRRNNNKVDRDKFIKIIAEEVKNPVDLSHPDKIIRIEVLGNVSGISFLKPTDIISFKDQVNVID